MPVTAFRLLAGLKPLNRCLSVLDLSFCRLDNLVAADPNMKVYKVLYIIPMNALEQLPNPNLIIDNISLITF